MKFGLFLEQQLPRPWDSMSETRVLQEALEQCVLADRLGFDYVWAVEHHFLEEYAHSSAPEVLLGAVAARTSRIRVGHGVVLTAPGYCHPARVAEKISTLDRLSGGRVDFGSGESGSLMELDGFGIDPADKHEQWLEGLRVAVRCMTETPFRGHQGRFVSMPPRNVIPKPQQTPHPPLWMACSRPASITSAAELGLGALSFAFADPEVAAEWVQAYEEALADRCVPIGLAVNPQITCVSTMACHPDTEEALRRGLVGANFFGYSIGHYYAFGEHRPGETDVWDEFIEKRDSVGYSPEIEIAQRWEVLGAKVAAGETEGLRGAIGNPDQVRQFMRRYEAAGVDQVAFIVAGGKTTHEHVMESIEIFGREVLPEFAERDPESSARKRERLAPVIEQALRRREEVAEEVPGDYVVEALPRRAFRTMGGDDLVRDIETSTAAGNYQAFRDAYAKIPQIQSSDDAG